MTIDELTDEEAIATARLLGCTFFKNRNSKWWFVDDNDDNDSFHPLETIKYMSWQTARFDGNNAQSHWGWSSQAALARDYIEWWVRENKR